MQNKYPLDLKSFVEQQLASGEFASEYELVVEALRVYRSVRFPETSKGIQLRSDELRDIMGEDV